MTTPHESPRRQLAPLVGWLVVLGASLLSILLTDDSVWARGVLATGGEITATQGVLVGVPGYEGTVILAFAGLGVASVVGVAAVPWSRATRWVLTAALGAVLVLAWSITAVEETDPVVSELVGALVISVVPVALLLVLVWRRLRRTCAWVATVALVVGLLAHAVTLIRLLASDGSPAAGAWAMAAVLVLGLAGALVVLRSVSAGTGQGHHP